MCHGPEEKYGIKSDDCPVVVELVVFGFCYDCINLHGDAEKGLSRSVELREGEDDVLLT